MRLLGAFEGGKTTAQVALNYIISKGAIPIVGVKNVAQVRQGGRHGAAGSGREGVADAIPEGKGGHGSSWVEPERQRHEGRSLCDLSLAQALQIFDERLAEMDAEMLRQNMKSTFGDNRGSLLGCLVATTSRHSLPSPTPRLSCPHQDKELTLAALLESADSPVSTFHKHLSVGRDYEHWRSDSSRRTWGSLACTIGEIPRSPVRDFRPEWQPLRELPGDPAAVEAPA
eukprot:768413-Hanusia_phi.AAC.1